MNITLSLLVAALACSVVPALASAADDVVVADFEVTDYAGWTVTGTAFGTGPAHGTLPDQQPVDGFLGKGLVNSYAGGDRSTGTLTSPPFALSRDYVSLLVGGGFHPGRTCVDLRIGGKVVATATGNDAEHLDWQTWDVRPYKGRLATVQIVDRETGQWGHVNVDQIVQTDHPPVPPDADQPLYGERFRPQFHFTPPRNWINDPNGLVYFAGEYHLFYQSNPSGIEWGNMTWGHAVSTDLAHWTPLPDALRPDPLGTMFSGSAAVDWKNTSGFGRGAEPPLVAMYTAAGGTSPASKGKPFTQCLAYSTDRGRTWAKFAGNPVIPHVAGENRDPKLIWHEPTRRWVVALYLDGDRYALFTSADLKRWDRAQEFAVPGCSECPDFFPLPLDGDAGRVKWVFTCADGRYVVGSFDGTRFTVESDRRQVDFGRNYYAVQSYSDAPDGRRVQVAWMRGRRYPRMPFNGQMSFPAEMTLRTTPDGPRLFRTPARQIELLQGDPRTLRNVPLPPGENPLADVAGDGFRVVLDVEPAGATEVGLVIRGETIRYSVPGKSLDALGTAPLELDGGHLRLDVLVDRTTIETFANGGRVSMTSCFTPTADGAPLRLFASGGTAKVASVAVYPVRSALPAAVAGRR